MSLFKCSKCACIDNTALGHYWNGKALCCKCDPEIGKWHGRFKRVKMGKDYIEGEDGFVYHRTELKLGGYFYGRVKIKGKNRTI